MQKIVTWHKIKFKIKNVHLKVNHPKKGWKIDSFDCEILNSEFVKNSNVDVLKWAFFRSRDTCDDPLRRPKWWIGREYVYFRIDKYYSRNKCTTA